MICTAGRLIMSCAGRTRTHLCELFRFSPPLLLREEIARFLDRITAALVPFGVQIDRTLQCRLG
ncbi:hypothetical protein AKJ13_28990 [Methylobacterium sp. ARG-1]|nr:hypothetical protein AKJ13_28990 [Methylobacterium sp. ARG-1]